MTARLQGGQSGFEYQGTVQYHTTLCNTIQSNIRQENGTQYNRTQDKGIEYNTVQGLETIARIIQHIDHE
jgi:hypothetical protein